jgi:hypothetical protein
MIYVEASPRTRKRRKDPEQEKVLQIKDDMNEHASALIELWKQEKKRWNGRDPRSPITDPLPEVVNQGAAEIKQETDSLLQKLKGLIDAQNNYSIYYHDKKQREDQEKLLKQQEHQMKLQQQQHQVPNIPPPVEQQNLPDISLKEDNEKKLEAFRKNRIEKYSSNIFTRIWNHISALNPMSGEKGRWERLILLRSAANLQDDLKVIADYVLAGDKGIYYAVQTALNSFAVSKGTIFDKINQFVLDTKGEFEKRIESLTGGKKSKKSPKEESIGQTGGSELSQKPKQKPKPVRESKQVQRQQQHVIPLSLEEQEEMFKELEASLVAANPAAQVSSAPPTPVVIPPATQTVTRQPPTLSVVQPSTQTVRQSVIPPIVPGDPNAVSTTSTVDPQTQPDPNQTDPTQPDPGVQQSLDPVDTTSTSTNVSLPPEPVVDTTTTVPDITVPPEPVDAAKKPTTDIPEPEPDLPPPPPPDPDELPDAPDVPDVTVPLSIEEQQKLLDQMMPDQPDETELPDEPVLSDEEILKKQERQKELEFNIKNFIKPLYQELFVKTDAEYKKAVAIFVQLLDKDKFPTLREALDGKKDIDNPWLSDCVEIFNFIKDERKTLTNPNDFDSIQDILSVIRSFESILYFCNLIVILSEKAVNEKKRIVQDRELVEKQKRLHGGIPENVVLNFGDTYEAEKPRAEQKAKENVTKNLSSFTEQITQIKSEIIELHKLNAELSAISKSSSYNEREFFRKYGSILSRVWNRLLLNTPLATERDSDARLIVDQYISQAIKQLDEVMNFLEAKNLSIRALATTIQDLMKSLANVYNGLILLASSYNTRISTLKSKYKMESVRFPYSAVASGDISKLTRAVHEFEGYTESFNKMKELEGEILEGIGGTVE